MTSLIEKLKLGKIFGNKPENSENGVEQVESSASQPGSSGPDERCEPAPPFSTDSAAESTHDHADSEKTPHLQSLDQERLAQWAAGKPERMIVRALQDLTDQELQLRIIRCVSEEKTLKRVIRSELAKKVKRAAEKRLRELETGNKDPHAEKMHALSETIQSFLKEPHWEKAEELLDSATDSALDVAPAGDENSHAHFLELRQRLRTEIDKYEDTRRELEEICTRLDPAQALRKSELEKLARRWKELQDRYFFSAQLLERFRVNLEIQRGLPEPAVTHHETRKLRPESTPPTPSASPSPVKPAQAAAQKELEAQPATQDKSREKADPAQEKQRRQHVLDRLLQRLHKAGNNLAHPQATSVLRQIQKEIPPVQRWKREFPEKIEEIDTVLKALLSRRNELVNENEWETWARTDQATRLLAEMEERITALESSEGIEGVEGAVGLGPRLVDYSRELKALGKLRPEKDHEIWKNFKVLSQRGWAVCEKINVRIVELLKATLSEHAQHPLEEPASSPEIQLEAAGAAEEAKAAPGKAPSKATAAEKPIQFKPGAFENGVPEKIQALRAAWTLIGGKRPAESRRLEADYSRITTAYFRQLNLSAGHRQRAESALHHRKRGLIADLHGLKNNQSFSVLDRIRGAKKIQERWLKEEFPLNSAAELTAEFDGALAKIRSELAAEVQRHAQAATATESKLAALLEEIRAKTGANLAQATQAAAQLEKEVQGATAFMTGLRNLQTTEEPVEAAAIEEYQKIKDRVGALFVQLKETVQGEARERSAEKTRLLQEAETLALSSDWEHAGGRLEELKKLALKTGKAEAGQDQAMSELLFEHVCRYFKKRSDGAAAPEDLKKDEKALKERQDLLISLEALLRLKNPEAAKSAAPGAGAAMNFGKVLEYGLKYKQILAMDPQGAILKETKKIMELWIKTGSGRETVPPELWRSYLDRLRLLLRTG